MIKMNTESLQERPTTSRQWLFLFLCVRGLHPAAGRPMERQQGVKLRGALWHLQPVLDHRIVSSPGSQRAGSGSSGGNDLCGGRWKMHWLCSAQVQTQQTSKWTFCFCRRKGLHDLWLHREVRPGHQAVVFRGVSEFSSLWGWSVSLPRRSICTG